MNLSGVACASMCRDPDGVSGPLLAVVHEALDGSVTSKIAVRHTSCGREAAAPLSFSVCMLAHAAPRALLAR